MPDEADIETKVAAWRLHTQDNLPQREVARRLGISQASVSRYVQEGREAEVYVVAFAKAELRGDVAFQLRWLIHRWMTRLAPEAEPLDLKEELQVSRELALLLAQFSTLMGLNEPTRTAVGPDTPEPHTPNAQMVAAIEEAQRDNQAYLARIRAGLPAHEEEESA